MLTFQNVNGQTAPSATNVGMVLNRLGDGEQASHLVMNAERQKEWHDFKTEVIRWVLMKCRMEMVRVEAVISRDTASDYPTERVEDMGDKYSQGTSWKHVRKRLLHCTTTCATGHEVTRGQDAGNTTAESVERTRWTSDWSQLRRLPGTRPETRTRRQGGGITRSG